MSEKNKNLLFSLFDKYGLSNSDKEYLLMIIKDIYIHDEFQRRMTDQFVHHNEITLGQHILEVTIMTYILSKRNPEKKNFDLDIAIKIAMLHDLYTVPWQNNPNASVNKFFNKHGFRHPIESAINAMIWYPDLFKENDKSKKIIDGIVHHMFPLPVITFEDDYKSLELKNYESIKKLNNINKDILIYSSNRFRIGKLSFCPSLYNEGKVMSQADKIVSISNFKRNNYKGLSTLITGKNKSLQKRK